MLLFTELTVSSSAELLFVNLLLALHSCLMNLISIILIMKKESCCILSIGACCMFGTFPAPVRFLGWERLQICNKQNKVRFVWFIVESGQGWSFRNSLFPLVIPNLILS